MDTRNSAGGGKSWLTIERLKPRSGMRPSILRVSLASDKASIGWVGGKSSGREAVDCKVYA
jgi:hypothetical protein